METTNFTWIPFIDELAHKLLEYKDNRQPLVDAFVELTGGRYKNLQNIDPYTFISLFLRNINNKERLYIISKQTKDMFSIKNNIPSDYNGIPLQYNNFFDISADVEEQNKQIETLWNLFEAQMNNDAEGVEKWFNEIMQFSWRMITFGLYMVNPQEYISLNRHSVNRLKMYSINGYIFQNGNGTYQKYTKTIEHIKQKMDAGEIAEKTFPEFVHNARNYNDETVDNIIRDNTMNYKSYIEEYKQIIERKLNLILQGAPGTGKTYSTAALALSICGVTDVDLNDHNAVMERYEQLRFDKEKNPDGQIGFCTFHQSMDYEDFVEGIKPKTINEQIVYEIEPGIFKTMCENAKNITTEKKSDKIDFSKTRVFKMSLGEKGKDDVEIFDYCLENNVIGLGWGGDKDFSQCEKREDFKRLDDTWGATAMEIFKQWMQIGDIVLISDGTKAVKAIARIIGNYEYHKDTPIEMYQFRKVEWLYTGDLIPISKLYNKNLSQQSIYAFYIPNEYGKSDFNNTLKVDVINDIITGEVDGEKPKNYVLIIDEINRGNVSRIFGELITLLEADKRLGGEHPIKVTLPYSKESFGVPKNLYIIGTMNTTDRSVGNIDYAVRRRFAFATLESQRELVEQHSTEQGVRLYDAVRKFIEKSKAEMDFDDLMVGHSYFFVGSDEQLEMRWQYEIKPLLNEYIKDGLLNAETIRGKMTVEEFCRDAPRASADMESNE